MLLKNRCRIYCTRPLPSQEIYTYGFYSILSALIITPLLKSGYVLTLDMIFTPKILAPHGLSNTYVWQYLLHYMNLIVNAQSIEKLILFLILELSGIGIHKLIN